MGRNKNPKGFGFLLVMFLQAALLAACTPASPAVLPTSQPAEYLSTAIALTVQAGQAPSDSPTPAPPTPTEAQAPQRSPTPTRTPSPTPPQATATPTTEPTATPSPSFTPAPRQGSPTPGIPDAAIQILYPGPQSRLISPLRLSAYLKPGLDGRVQIELVGEDGRILVRKVLTYNPDVGRVYLKETLEFEIGAVAETARLQISTYDSNKRPLAMGSVDLLLLSFGEDDLNPPGSLLERILIEEPLPNKLIQGGNLVVAGLAHPTSDKPLLIELTTAAGKVVGYRQAGLVPDPQGGYVPFRVEVPYTVEKPTWVRLSVREDSSGRIEGTIYLTSLEVLLSP